MKRIDEWDEKHPRRLYFGVFVFSFVFVVGYTKLRVGAWDESLWNGCFSAISILVGTLVVRV